MFLLNWWRAQKGSTDEQSEALGAVGWVPIHELSRRELKEPENDGARRVFLCSEGNLEPGDRPSRKHTGKAPFAVVVKVVPAALLDEESVARLNSEVRILAEAAIGHPRVLRLLGTAFHVGKGFHLVEYEGYLGGMMDQHLKYDTSKRSQETGVVLARGMPTRKALFYCAEVASALDFLHSRGVCHRDVAASNVALDHQGHAVLLGFGLAHATPLPSPPPSSEAPSSLFSSYSVAGGGGCSSSSSSSSSDEPHKSSSSERMHTLCGTPHAMAPDMLATAEESDGEAGSGQGYGTAVDWWGLGTLFWELLAGTPPFGGGVSSGCRVCAKSSSEREAVVQQHMQLFEAIKRGLPVGEPTSLPPRWSSSSVGAIAAGQDKDLLSATKSHAGQAAQEGPSFRCASTIESPIHEAAVCSLLQQLLTVDPSQRLGSTPNEEVLAHAAWDLVLVTPPSSSSSTPKPSGAPGPLAFLARMVAPPPFEPSLSALDHVPMILKGASNDLESTPDEADSGSDSEV
jgi:serine/threonine protein kinase